MLRLVFPLTTNIQIFLNLLLCFYVVVVLILVKLIVSYCQFYHIALCLNIFFINCKRKHFFSLNLKLTGSKGVHDVQKRAKRSLLFYILVFWHIIVIIYNKHNNEKRVFLYLLLHQCMLLGGHKASRQPLVTVRSIQKDNGNLSHLLIADS